MGKPFNGVSTEFGETLLSRHLTKIKKEIETYYNRINLVALSPPGAQVETIPEKPAILVIVDRIESSGKLLLDGGLMQQPHIFMEEYYLALALKKLFETITASAFQKK